MSKLIGRNGVQINGDINGAMVIVIWILWPIGRGTIWGGYSDNIRNNLGLCGIIPIVTVSHCHIRHLETVLLYGPGWMGIILIGRSGNVRVYGQGYTGCGVI